MIVFSYLNKNEKDIYLPKLFDLLYDNMCTIAPATLTYEQEKAEWLANVSPALEKAPRQILLCFVNDVLAGYIQYYIRDRLLMVEEIQLKKEYQRTFLFYHFGKYLMQSIPTDIQYIEAYAEKRNLNSQKIMKKLGMDVLEENTESPFVHLRGTTQKAKAFFGR